nr:arginase family protein [Candidatus Acidoferrales bacterium]
MAVKIVRQPRKIAIIGAPTSAAALAPGHERAPAALRAAGIVERLQAAGFEVTDMGDCKTQISQPDPDHPRARNIPPLVAELNELRPHVEVAVKSGALPLILGGDCSIVLATVAGARRYYRHVGLIYVDRDADMNVPATTPSGNVDGMVVSHLIGRGAPELIRFWGEPPLVREPDIVLFGVDRLDAPEKIALDRSPIRRYLGEDIRRTGVTAAAESAVARMQGGQHEFVLHLDVDAISSNEFSAATYAGPDGGMSLADVQKAMAIFAARPNMLALEVATYNPTLDPDGSAAKVLVELLVGILTVRLAALESPAETAAEANNPVSAPSSEARPPEAHVETSTPELPTEEPAPAAEPEISDTSEIPDA